MNRRANIVARLRRYRTGIGRFALALFACASIAAPAAPCFAMATDGGARAEMEHTAHDHAAARLDHGAQQHAVSQHDHHAASGSHGVPGTHCPHCPVTTTAGHVSTAHSFCSESSPTSDHGQGQSPSAALLKHVTTATVVAVIPLSSFLRPPSGAPPDVPAARPPSVALNVQHCVFLI